MKDCSGVVLDILAPCFNDVARIRDTRTGESRRVYRYGAGGLMHLEGSRVKCGYWETLFDLFDWACSEAGFDFEHAEWIDAQTLEVMTYWDVIEESDDE